MAIVLIAISSCLDPGESGNLVPKTVVEDSSLPALEINNTKLHLETYGDPKNPVIIFLHGGPGNDYRALLPLKESYDGYSLSDNYFLVFWDQRSTGLSKRHSINEISLELYAEDLDKLIEYFAPDNKPIVLVGHSWGGQYAAQYLNRHPNRLSGCVMLEPGKFSTELGKKLPPVNTNLFSKWINDWIWGRQLIAAEDHERADYYAALGVASVEESQAQRKSKPAPFWRLGTAVLTHLYLNELEKKGFDFTAHLPEVAIPLLFIAGANTEDLGADFQRIQMKLFKNASLEIIPNAGHADIVFDQASASVARIRPYLDGLKLGGRP
jgi:proline iminopeptidase